MGLVTGDSRGTDETNGTNGTNGVDGDDGTNGIGLNGGSYNSV